LNRKRRPIAAAALTILLAPALIACGDDSESDEAAEAEASVTPEQAIEEIAAVRSGLDDALATYETGDATAAADTVSETYLQHFELVEVPLEEADEELNEELEEGIREELVAEMEAEAPAAEVKRLVADLNAELDEAEKVLEGA
jgi:hypothetical protein